MQLCRMPPLAAELQLAVTLQRQATRGRSQGQSQGITCRVQVVMQPLWPFGRQPSLLPRAQNQSSNVSLARIRRKWKEPLSPEPLCSALRGTPRQLV